MNRWRLLAATALVGVLVNQATGWRVPGIAVSVAVGLAFDFLSRTRRQEPVVDAWTWTPPTAQRGTVLTLREFRDAVEPRGFVVGFHHNPRCHGGAWVFVRLAGMPIVHETLDFRWDEVGRAWTISVVDAMVAINRMLTEGEKIALASS